MCLFTKTNQMEIAEDNITCYKVLYYLGNNAFMSPYQRFKYTLKRYDNHEPVEFCENKCCENSITAQWGYKLDKNVFHSFAYFYDALNELKTFRYIGTCPCIVECVIPIDTEYIEGSFDWYKSYASKSIIIKKTIVEPKKVVLV